MTVVKVCVMMIVKTGASNLVLVVVKGIAQNLAIIHVRVNVMVLQSLAHVLLVLEQQSQVPVLLVLIHVQENAARHVRELVREAVLVVVNLHVKVPQNQAVLLALVHVKETVKDLVVVVVAQDVLLDVRGLVQEVVQGGVREVVLVVVQ